MSAFSQQIELWLANLARTMANYALAQAARNEPQS